MKLLVVTVNYRVTDLTIDCLRSLSSEIHRVPSAKVAVCENGSGDDSEQRLREAIEANSWGDWAELTAIDHNRGFSGGNNLIIRVALASGDPPQYVLLLNPDTLVQVHALEALVDFMDVNPHVGIAGSRLEAPDGTLHASAFRYQGVASEFDRGLRLGLVSKLLSRWAVVPPAPSSPCEVDWVPGASMIIRRQVFDTIGLLDEGFFTYFEDMDFCMNAKRAGWPTWVVPESRVIHLEGASTGVDGKAVTLNRLPKYWFHARRRFFLKNYGPVYAALADAAFILGFALWQLRRWLQRKPDIDPPHMLLDSVQGSVFVAGFRLSDVESLPLNDGESG